MKGYLINREALFLCSSGSFEAVFKGLYVLSHEKSKETGILTYERVSTIMPTYYPKDAKQPSRIAEAYNADGYKVAHFYTENQIEEFGDKYKGKYEVVRL